ncbi:hypothetical protein FLA105534_00144 [Flavobacterium bizetiae]|uniref:DDE domain-containing protein n=1 Tax=Flavobacterium bizetiae TaxID=2704140 RepID=A0A6J4G6F2_9FLAO|nr:hypothetical protein FLA105534_00144 [Flavobacterium bizetiae]CAD5348612.1 hypothetical protein FLA105534_02579 [Flavobacterium bizetiae]
MQFKLNSFVNIYLEIYKPKYFELFILKGKVGRSWRLDNTYIKVNVIWFYLYRAVDKLDNIVDFLLTRKRHRTSTKSFLFKAISNNNRPRVINIDKIGSNTPAIKV